MLRSLVWPAVLLLAAAGCRPQEEIARYTVPKEHLIDATASDAAAAASASRQQMLAAVVLVGNAGWFFKLTADPTAGGKLEEPFIDFIRSLTFSEGPEPKPQWQLPEGWKERPGNQFRYATIEVPGPKKPLELTVTTLPKQAGDDQAYVLANINRWRGQLQLPDLAADELAVNSLQLQVGKYPGTLVNLVGEGTGSMAPGPFASGLPPVASTNEGSGPKAPTLDFQKPESWRQAPPKPLSLLSFETGDASKSATITVTVAGGDLLANVNRWRGQVELPPLGESELAESLSKIDTLGVTGDYAQIRGPAKTILGVAATAGGAQYFIKLIGPSDVAQSEQANFESFVKSLQQQ